MKHKPETIEEILINVFKTGAAYKFNSVQELEAMAKDKAKRTIPMIDKLIREKVIGEDVIVSGSYPLEDWKKERAQIINNKLNEQRKALSQVLRGKNE